MKLRKSSCTLFAATVLALAGCGDSDTTTTYTTNPVPDLLITIGQQERKAAGAKGSADMSLKDATTKATMLSAVKVKGESSDAEANAQAILDAKGKVDSALMEANAALTALQKAKTEAAALPADTPKLEELKAGLAKAITEATRHRDAIKAIRDAKGNDSLAKLVEKVTGADGKKTPAEIAATVAQEVHTALKTAYRLTVPVNTYANADGTLAEYNKAVISDLPGVRIESNDYFYYGYWLAVPAGSGKYLEVSHFGIPRYNYDLQIPVEAVNASTTLKNTATYSGKALGFSVVTAGSGNSRKAVKSGEFTASVNLTATFADAPTVKGTVTDFVGNAVGTDWKLTLKDAPLHRFSLDTTTASDLGETKSGSAPKDTWHAVAVDGTADKRPMRITGAFKGNFTDGRVVGGYGVVKDE